MTNDRTTRLVTFTLGYAIAVLVLAIVLVSTRTFNDPRLMAGGMALAAYVGFFVLELL